MVNVNIHDTKNSTPHSPPIEGIGSIYYALYHKLPQDVSIADGFFEGWPNPPDKCAHRRILAESYMSVVAVDRERHLIVGFLNVVSDGVLSAYIPLLEVIPAYRHQGIGTQLVKIALEKTSHLYMVDLCCDAEFMPFYEKMGMSGSNAMIRRNYDRQNASLE